MFSLLSHLTLLLTFSLNTLAQTSFCPEPTYAPLPKQAQGPRVSNTTGYRLEHFGAGAFMVTDGIYQAMFFIACESVIVVDNPPTLGYKMLEAIQSVTSKPVSHFVYSHAHSDHTGGASLFGTAANVTFVAHELTAQELALAPDPTRPAPTLTFSSGHYDLVVCNQTLSLNYAGPNHEPGNILIYSASSQSVMYVDIVFPGWVPFSQLGVAESVPGYIAAHRDILSYDFKNYVGGHIQRAGTRKDVQNAADYMSDLFDNCKEAIFLSASPPNASNPISVYTLLPPVEARYPGNAWAEFNTYFDKVQQYCSNKTTMQWLGRLAGADVYTASNAYTMINSLRIDYGILGPFGVMA